MMGHPQKREAIAQSIIKARDNGIDYKFVIADESFPGNETMDDLQTALDKLNAKIHETRSNITMTPNDIITQEFN